MGTGSNGKTRVSRTTSEVNPSARLARYLLPVWLLSLACTPPRNPPDLPPRVPPIAEAETGTQQQPSCVRSWPEARYRNYGYDHIVHLNSRCHRTASCNVSTDASPKVIAVAVAPGEHLEVLTLSGSPIPEFVANVECARGTR